MSVQKILSKNNFYPYKVHLVQELSEDDFDRRVEFCEDIMRRSDMDLQFDKNSFFEWSNIWAEWQY